MARPPTTTTNHTQTAMPVRMISGYHMNHYAIFAAILLSWRISEKVKRYWNLCHQVNYIYKYSRLIHLGIWELEEQQVFRYSKELIYSPIQLLLGLNLIPHN